MSTKLKIATHNGSFHADDVFGVAILSILYNDMIEVSRTRDPLIIDGADIVLDVGRVYDPQKKRFDHHQVGGAGLRSNGIPYASAGLLWKEYGVQLCSNNIDISAKIDSRLIAPIDANDVGMSIVTPLQELIRPYTVSAVIGSLNPAWNEDFDLDVAFMEGMEIAKTILKREIAKSTAEVVALNAVKEAYTLSKDPRVLTLEKNYPWFEATREMPDVLFVISPHTPSTNWQAKAVPRGSEFSYVMRFPEEWRGKEGKELKVVTGEVGAVFAHLNGFAVYAENKESAASLVDKTLNIK